MKYVKLSALIAGLSIATFSVPQVKALVLTDLLNRKLPVFSTSLQKKSQAKPTLSSSISSKPSSSNLIAEAMPRENKIKLVNDTQSEAKPETIAEEKGKLKIVNDTPFMAIVQLYKPDANEPNNYAYIPPCYERILLSSTYSNLWQVSFNGQRKKTVGEVSDKKGNTFEVITSNLNQDTKRTCKYKLIADPVGISPWQDLLKYVVTQFEKAIKSPRAQKMKLGLLTRIKEITDLHLQNMFTVKTKEKKYDKIHQAKDELSSLITKYKYKSKPKSKSQSESLKSMMNDFNKYLSSNNIEKISNLNKFEELIAFVETSNHQEEIVTAMLQKEKDTNPILNPYKEKDTNQNNRASANRASSFASAIYKNDVFQVSSIIDFSKWYASSLYLSEPASGAYNVAALRN
ncbi:hypothetical protein QHH11_01180 [Aphanizomenon sp. PH219]|nr:hypothetical protein [Aphanizomenon sp. 202]MDK2457763.1 hypothetical protein [Aphanizomenon sp. PH219]